MKWLTLLLVFLIMLLVVTPLPTTADVRQTATPNKITTTPSGAGEDATDEKQNPYADILSKGEDYQGTTAKGYYYLGNPDAPILLEVFASFSCPHCERWAYRVQRNILDKIEGGYVQLVYVPVINFGPFSSANMTKMAMCAGEQGKFWQAHDLMFEWLESYGAQSNDIVRILEAANQLRLDVSEFTDCYKYSRYDGVFAAAAEEVVEREIEGVPTVYLNGHELESSEGGPVGLQELRDTIDAAVEAAR
jgi:protein-disulfide isomerase